ncbi:MAG TPA: aminofutalosine synthase MqnE [Desulfomonilaceae bacterium]|nr:aminofutalosine synthase MqnE [Desulfomonilaceae bacterium]
MTQVNSSRIIPNPHEILNRISDAQLLKVGRKFLSGARLDFDDGIACLVSNDTLGLGTLAFADRKARYGDRASYVVNHHINYTNVCVNGCKFCAFYRNPTAEDGYVLGPDEVVDQIRAASGLGLTEVHIVGGVNPELDFAYYLNLLASLRTSFPAIKIKAFTAVEIDQIAKKASLGWRECLAELQKGGLDMLPGGGAEIFSDRVRQSLFPAKIGADSWLTIHGEAHRLGIGTNATMLFGHIETVEERIDHLIRLRNQQDETGGFRAFIPLVFHPRNTSLADLSGPTALETLKTIAVSRLLLDNVDHIKAYWVMLGMKLAQMALYFGADDLEGTIVAEKIAHEAGAGTAAGLSKGELEQCILDAGFQPAERDTFHRSVVAA